MEAEWCGARKGRRLDRAPSARCPATDWIIDTSSNSGIRAQMHLKATLPGEIWDLHVDRARIDAFEGDGGYARDHAKTPSRQELSFRHGSRASERQCCKRQPDSIRGKRVVMRLGT